MKTKEEIRQEIIELYGSRTVLQEVTDDLHKKIMNITKKMFALNHMLKEIEEGDKNES